MLNITIIMNIIYYLDTHSFAYPNPCKNVQQNMLLGISQILHKIMHSRTNLLDKLICTFLLIKIKSWIDMMLNK